jgi:cytidine deaminase
VAALVREARRARRRAYAPYSRFAVGAAVLTASGAIVSGCNVENASYGLSNCAERVAIQRAVAQGHRRLRVVAVVGGRTGVLPCGACRQVMVEFGVTHVVAAGPTGSYRTYPLTDLLGHAFGPPDLAAGRRQRR